MICHCAVCSVRVPLKPACTVALPRIVLFDFFNVFWSFWRRLCCPVTLDGPFRCTASRPLNAFRCFCMFLHMFFHAFRCFVMPLHAFRCFSMHSHVFWCFVMLSMLFDALRRCCACFSMIFHACRYLSIPLDVFNAFSILLILFDACDAFRRISMLADCFLMLLDAFSYVLMLLGAFCFLMCFDAFQRFLMLF